MKHQWGLKMGTQSVWEGDSLERRWTVTEVRGKNWKRFWKLLLFLPNTRFSRLKRVANKSPVQAAKTHKDKSLKNFSKCFSWLEGLPTSESRAEPRKYLSNPRDLTFHLWTSHQKWPAKTRLRLATWLTRDWVVKTGQKWIFEIFRIF